MAGIGFELRKLIRGQLQLAVDGLRLCRHHQFRSPWILSIIAVLLSVSSHCRWSYRRCWSPNSRRGYLSDRLQPDPDRLVQLAFTLYSADRIFEKEHYRLLPNLTACAGVIVVSGVLSYPIGMLEFPQQAVLRLLFAATFVVLCCVWVTAICFPDSRPTRRS